MSKIYLVTAVEQLLVTYEVKASDEDQARHKVENREPSDGVREVASEYYDFDYIRDVEVQDE